MKRLTHYIIAIALIFSLTVTADAAQMLIPVGQVVGLELADNTVTVASFDEKLGQAAKNAGADVFIDKMPDGYDTPLTRLFEQSATELSVGQWQKLSVASNQA